MLGIRERRAERKEERHGAENVRYKMREKLVAIGDDFYIEDAQGRKAFKVDGKALRMRNTLIFRDMQDQPLVQIQEKMLRVKDSMAIDDANGHTIATVKKAMIAPLRQRFSVKIGDGPDLDVQGNILDHEYTIGEGRDKIAEVSKKWFRVRDTYGVEIEPGQNDVLILAVTAAIDQMASPE
jgi:uncharacterized protein YxjI